MSANFGPGLRTQEPQALHTPGASIVVEFAELPCDPQIRDKVKQQKGREV